MNTGSDGVSEHSATKGIRHRLHNPSGVAGTEVAELACRWGWHRAVRPEGGVFATTTMRACDRRWRQIVRNDPPLINTSVETIPGRLEYLRGIALGFRNLDHYIVRSLVHSGHLEHRIRKSTLWVVGRKSPSEGMSVEEA
ncbi:hypothetical protein J2X34_000611 [Rhodococcus sp. BE178]